MRSLMRSVMRSVLRLTASPSARTPPCKSGLLRPAKKSDKLGFRQLSPARSRREPLHRACVAVAAGRSAVRSAVCSAVRLERITRSRRTPRKSMPSSATEKSDKGVSRKVHVVLVACRVGRKRGGAVPQRPLSAPFCRGMAPARPTARKAPQARQHARTRALRGDLCTTAAPAGGRDEPALDAAAQQLDFARWFADWWLRRGRRLAAEAQRHADA